jgi:6-phosphogluconolactonase
VSNLIDGFVHAHRAAIYPPAAHSRSRLATLKSRFFLAPRRRSRQNAFTLNIPAFLDTIMTHTLVHGGLFTLLLFGAAFFAAPAPADDAAKADKLRMYVGTYSGGKSKGIYLFEMDPATGALTSKGVAAETVNPSFLAVHPSHKFLYAVGEIEKEVKGKRTGAVSAFAIDPRTGMLSLLNQQPSGGGGPCHLVVDKAGKNVLVANYGGGSVASLPIDADGKLREPVSVIQHKGSSVDPSRQKEPHAHSINLDAGNHFAFAADLGLDKVLVYPFDPEKGTLTADKVPPGTVAPGAGPRHFAFHPNGHWAYVINEMGNTVTAYSYDADKGALKEVQTIGTLPSDFKGKSYTAEVVVHPSGKFLYGSNRGHNSIAIFSIDPKTGKLTAVGHQAKDIKTPRNFNIDPSGKFLVVANQDGDSLIVYRIDPQTGELAPVGEPVEVPKPVCVKFVPMGR